MTFLMVYFRNFFYTIFIAFGLTSPKKIFDKSVFKTKYRRLIEKLKLSRNNLIKNNFNVNFLYFPNREKK